MTATDLARPVGGRGELGTVTAVPGGSAVADTSRQVEGRCRVGLPVVASAPGEATHPRTLPAPTNPQRQEQPVMNRGWIDLGAMQMHYRTLSAAEAQQALAKRVTADFNHASHGPIVGLRWIGAQCEACGAINNEMRARECNTMPAPTSNP